MTDDDMTFTTDPESIELRVLHGPQAGARLPLVRGQAYTIGSGDTCAVVLGGAQVAPEHALITADDQGITVLPLEGRVKTLTGPVEADSAVLPLGTVLQFGLVKLTVARFDDEWLPDDALETAPAASEEVATEEPEAARSPAPTGAASGPPGVAHASPEVRARRRVPGGWAMACIAGVVIAGVGAVLAFSGTTEAKPAGDMARPLRAASAAETASASARTMAELIKGFPGGTLTAKPQPGGSWIVTGRLATDAERQVLREAASATGLTVQVRVTVESERLATVKQFAQANQVPGRVELRVESGHEGAVRIAGVAATPEEAASVQERARKELAEQEPLEFDIALPDRVQQLFMQRLGDLGMKEKFQVIQGSPKLVVRAVLGPQDIRTFETTFAEFTKQHGSVLPIVAQIQPERDVIEAAVATVVGGAFPYIVTTSGQRVAPGGVLGGHTVVAVRDGEIILSEGLRVRYGP